MRRSFHWKRLLIVLGVFTLVGGGLFALNRLQAKRQASIIKSVAQNSLQSINGDAERRNTAIDHYSNYVKIFRKDEEAATQLAHLLLDQYKAEPNQKSTVAAITGLEKFLRDFPEHHEERRELAGIYTKISRLQNAREHLDVLFNNPKADFKHDVELLEMASLCEQVAGETARAIEYLEEAIRTEKAPVRIFEKILRLLNANKADGLRETKIANYIRTLRVPPFTNDIQARITIARFELFRHEFVNAQRDIDFARSHIPGGDNNPDVLLAAAEAEIAVIQTNAEVKPRLENALALLQKAFQNDPKNVEVGIFLADIYARLGDQTQSVNILRETAKAFGPINDQYWVLIDRLLDLKNQDTAKALIDRTTALGKDDSLIKYFNGRLALINEDWIKARTLLEEAAPDLVRIPEHHKRAMAGLGIVYRNLENPDQELSCFRNALRDDGSFVLALIGEAEALGRLGRLDEAITRYQALVTAYQIFDLRPTLARFRLIDMLRKPLANRNWEKFDSDDTLGPAKERTSELWILFAQGLAARGEREKALKVLNELLNNEKSVLARSVAWVAIARIQEAGKPEAAIQVLNEARKQIGDTVDLRVAHAEALSFRAKPPTPVEFEELGQNAEKFSKADQFRLWFGLGQNAVNAQSRISSVGESNIKAKKALQEACIRFLHLAAQAEPRNLQSRASLIDIALIADRKEYLDATINELANLEGKDGPISTLARVSIRLADVKKKENHQDWNQEIKELRELTKKVVQKRPYWGRAYVALGQLDELEGLNEQAVEHYRQALNEGERDQMVIRKVVNLYRDRKQDAVAAGMLDELSTKMILPEDLERFRALFEMVNRDVPRSEKPTIDRIAPASSEDPRILLLRGSLLAAIREDAESLKAFRRAIDKSDNNAEAWEALIRQLVRTGDLASAKNACSEAEKALLPALQKSDLSATDKADLLIALGECCELCNDPKGANRRYEEALVVAPKELKPNRQMIQFLVRSGQLAESDKRLYQLANDQAHQDLARWARRYLASFSILSRPDAYQKRETALSLIAQNLAASPNDPEDIKARAVILTIDPVTREEGVQILKDYWSKGDLTPDESYHLGMLIFSLGPTRIPESVKYFESAAKPRPTVTIEHLAGLIRVYAALDNLDRAEATLEQRLRASAPNGWETTREEARLLMKKSQQAKMRNERDEAKRLSDRARSLILNFNGHDTAEAIRNRTGPLLAELNFNSEAELLYKKLIDLSDSPTAYTPLAILYIQTKRTEDSIKLAQQYEEKSPVLMTAQLLSASVRIKRPSKDSERDVENWLNKKITQYAGKPELGGLLAARAELLDAQEKYQESIDEYRRAIKEGAGESAVNNLAMLLALYEPAKVDEAISLMSGIIGIRGPVPTYLDTRAVAYLVKGGDATEKAVQDLKMARLQHARSVFAYHLAWAYDLQQKRNDRDRLLEEAQKIGIESTDLHPLERDKFFKLFGAGVK